MKRGTVGENGSAWGYMTANNVESVLLVVGELACAEVAP